MNTKGTTWAHACAHMTAPGSRCRAPSQFYFEGRAWCRMHKPKGAIRWWEHEQAQRAAAALPERHCPNCGAELDARRCKQVCTCGYFDDCSIGPA